MMVVSIGFFGKVDHRHGRITELTKEFQSVIEDYAKLRNQVCDQAADLRGC
jgi:hypothetical protein